MRTYELMFVVDPRVSDEDVVTMTQDYKNMITAGGSQITSEESWGRRKLAYPINKLTEGQYVLFLADLPAQALAGLEREFRLSEEILRFLIVRVDA